MCAWTIEWTRQPCTRSRVRHANHRRAFPSKLPVYCIWLALVASVSKGMRQVWARSPSAHAEVIGTNGFTALREGAIDRYNRARRRKGDSIPERGSFHKGLVLLCRDKYDKLLACMQIVDNTDNTLRQRYPATYFVYDLHLSGCQREFDGGQLKDSMTVRYAMRSGSVILRPAIICGVRNQAITTTTE